MKFSDFIGTDELVNHLSSLFNMILFQFRVESMMLRLAKNKNFVAVSPSIKQRADMNAPQSLPLIMEPESKYEQLVYKFTQLIFIYLSRFYTDPVIVLDFQSLYPSIIIAYNYCFSTCLGNIDLLGK